MLGKWVNVFEPKKDSIVIEDIAHALSNLCRFGGHPPKHYSVGQHSVHCCQMIKREHKFAALLHDASEAYMVDIPSPIKRNLANYKEIEDGLMKVIAEVFGFQYPFHKDIHTVDNLMLQKSACALFVCSRTRLQMASIKSRSTKSLMVKVAKTCPPLVIRVI